MKVQAPFHDRILPAKEIEDPNKAAGIGISLQ